MNNLKYDFFKVFLMLYVILTIGHPANAQTILAGEIPANYDVSSSGAFNYTLPLRIPPGIAGLVPNLAITYNSQGGNGQLGTGWTIDGLSSITMIPTDIYHNKDMTPIDFSRHQFALDGQRLFYTSPFANTFYTENKNFANITQYGTSGNGPSYFIVQYQNGLTYEYGNTTDSKMMASGRSDVLIWALNKIYDLHGNYITFEYYNNNSNGDYRVSKISYTGNTSVSLAPLTEINFNYSSKNDPGTSWVYGSVTSDNYVLSSIEIDQNSSMINKYIFEYHTGSYYTSRLVRIREQRPGNFELPPIEIKWGKEDQGYSPPVVSTSYATTNPNGFGDSLLMIGDFNADGVTDYGVRTPTFSSSTDVKVHFNNKNDDFGSATTVTVPNSYFPHTLMNRSRTLSMDYNGDGFDDLITYVLEYDASDPYIGTLRIFKSLSTGTSFGTVTEIFRYVIEGNPPNWLGVGGQDPRTMLYTVKIIPGDFDGDGKKEIMTVIPEDYSQTAFQCFIVGDMYPNGPSAYQIGTQGAVEGDFRYLARLGHDVISYMSFDYNGNGKDDVLFTSTTSSTELYELNCDYTNSSSYGITGSGTNLTLLYWGSYPSKDHVMYTGDFNGDGKGDLLTWVDNGTSSHIGTWDIAYSTGQGGTTGTAFSHPTAPNDLNPYGPGYPEWFGYYIGDFDGNGKDDILQMDGDPNNSVPVWSVRYLYGYNQHTTESFNMSGYPINTSNYAVGDFNGDGQSDIIWTGAANGVGSYPIISYFHKNDLRQLVTSITNAGRRIEIENSNLPQMSDYTTYPSPNSLPVHLTFPFISRQLPINVTSGLKDYVASSHSALSLDKSYRYSSLVVHLQGLGCQGFSKMETVDNAASTISIDKFHNTYNEAVTYLDSSETWDLTTYNGVVSLSLPGFPNTTPLHQKTQTMTDWGSGLIHNLTFDVLESNFVDATWTRVYPVIQNVSFFNDYGQPDSMIEIKGEVTTSKAYTYDPGAGFPNAGRPISTVITTTRDGKPSYIQKVNRTYLPSGDVHDETVDPGTTHETILHLWRDNFGNVIMSELTPYGLSTTSTSSVYSSDGRFKLSQTDNMGFTSSCTYNDWGQKLTVTEANGLTTRMTYDPFNREDSTITPTGGITTKTYDWASNNPSDNPSFQDAQFMIQEKSDDITNVAFRDYYKKELRTVKQDFSGQKVYKDTKYLRNGAVDYSTVSYYANSLTTPNTTTFTYDSYGRVASSSMTYGPTVQTVYSSTFIYNWGVDGMASTTWTANVPQWNQKTVTTDGSGVMVSVSEGNNAIHYDYNSNGKTESIQINNDPNYQTQYTYDDFGRMTSKYQYNMGTTTYEYNALNQITHEHYGLATDIYYTYDDLGRVIQKTNPDGNFDYTYNNIPNQPSTGKILSITSPYSTRYDYVYDNYGRKIEFDQQAGATFVTQYSYDIHNREVTHTYPDGDIIQKNYNRFGYLESIDLIGGTMPNQRLWQITGKNEFDQTTSADYFDATSSPLYTLSRTYNQGYPATIQFSKYMQPNMVDLSYSFDYPSGDLMSRQDNIKGSSGYREDFAYDAFDRLTTVSQYMNGINTHNLNMNYDDVGNITKKDDVTPTTHDWKYWGFALVQIPEPQISTPAYIIPSSEQTETYTYFKKVKTIEENNRHYDFTYYPDETRAFLYKSTLNPPNPPTYDEMDFYAENYEMQQPTGMNQKSQTYIVADGMLVAVIAHEIVPPPPGSPRNVTSVLAGTIYYPVADYLGSITYLFDNKGILNNGLVEERSFDAWGRTRDPNTWKYYIASTGAVPPTWIINHGYTGHEHYPEFNIINMNGRLYDPLIGRMYNCDPVLSDGTNVQAYNKYSYVNNNPMKYTDPSGKNPAALLIGAVIGGVVNCIVNAKRIDNFGTGLKYFGVGFASGLVGGVAGSAASAGMTGIAAAVTAGAIGGAAGAFVNSAGNSLVSGGNFKEVFSSGLVGSEFGWIGGAASAVLGSALSEGVGTIQREMYFSSHGIDGSSIQPTKENLINFAWDHFKVELGFMQGKGWNPSEHMNIGSSLDARFLDDPYCNAYTMPPGDDYSRVGLPEIVFRRSTFSSDRLLYVTMQHELVHAQDVLTGRIATWFFIGGCNKNFAIQMAELHAYPQSILFNWYYRNAENAGTMSDNLIKIESLAHYKAGVKLP